MQNANEAPTVYVALHVSHPCHYSLIPHFLQGSLFIPLMSTMHIFIYSLIYLLYLFHLFRGVSDACSKQLIVKQ